MPTIDPDIARIEARRKAFVITSAALLTRAKISTATHWDWIKIGTEPLKKTVRRLDAALNELIREKGLDPDAPLPAPAVPDPADQPPRTGE